MPLDSTPVDDGGVGCDSWFVLRYGSCLAFDRGADRDDTDALRALGAAGTQRVVMVPVSFVGEHIETLDEMDRELVELAHEAGIPHVGRARALGTTPAFLDALADVVRDTLARFGDTRCSRCLLPVPGTHRREGTCGTCGFVRPSYLTRGVGGGGVDGVRCRRARPDTTSTSVDGATAPCWRSTPHDRRPLIPPTRAE